MKILQVATPYLEIADNKITSGVTNITRSLTNELVARGHQVYLYAAAGSRTKARLVVSTAKAYDRQRLVVPYHNDLLHIFSVLGQAVKIAKEYKCDLIHNHINLVAPAMAQVADLPIVNTVHYSGFDKVQRDYFKITPYTYNIAISDAAKQSQPFIKFFARVYNGIEIDKFKFNEQGGKDLVWLGGIKDIKGTKEAIQVAALAGQRLHLYGTIRDSQYFTEEIKPHLHSARVVYHGAVKSAAKRSQILGRALALLFPVKWNEPFGLTMVEAMACGTPVIAFNKGSVQEIIKNGKTGYIVSGVRQMAAAVGKVASIDRRECRRVAEQRFSVATMTDNYEKVYRRIIKDFNKKNK